MHPIPEQVGVGVTSLTPLDLKGFRYESVGIYHNYHVTPTVWECLVATGLGDKRREYLPESV